MSGSPFRWPTKQVCIEHPCTQDLSSSPTGLYLSIRKRCRCLHSLILTREGLGEFSTVIQTRDEVEGLHNC